jgi:hypothetical protein
MRNDRKHAVWQPLRAAIALLVSADETFAESIGQKAPSKHLSLQSTLPGSLRDSMEADGALVLRKVGVRANPKGKRPKFDFLPSDSYRGRFCRVLRDFRGQNLSIEDFILARMITAGDEIGHWISEGWLTARDNNGEIPTALASTLRLDWEAEFEGGPPRLIMVDAVGRRRRDMEVNWPLLLECFRQYYHSDKDAEPTDKAWTSAPGIAVVGPVTRPTPVDPLKLETWPLACVLAWVEGAISHQTPESRDELLREAYKLGVGALPIDVTRASRYLLEFAAAHPDRLKLHHQDGIIQPSQLGPEALIFPTMVGSQPTFALRPHLVIQNAGDIGVRILGVWCQVREVRAAWPDSHTNAESLIGLTDIAQWKPTWLSLAGAIMWVVTRDARLTKFLDDRPNNDHNIILAVAAALAIQQGKTMQPVPKHVQIDDAWPAIRRLIADEKIIAEGRSVLRVGLTSSVTKTFPIKRIPSGDVGNLIIDNSVQGIDPKDALSPDADYTFYNGQGYFWFDVKLRAADVFREFPDTSAAVKVSLPEPQRDQQVSRPAGQVQRGRRKGSGSYEQFDQLLFGKMHKLIETGKAVSAEAAARLVASKAKGRGGEDSKVERLAKRYRASPYYARNKSD